VFARLRSKVQCYAHLPKLCQSRLIREKKMFRVGCARCRGRRGFHRHFASPTYVHFHAGSTYFRCERRCQRTATSDGCVLSLEVHALVFHATSRYSLQLAATVLTAANVARCRLNAIEIRLEDVDEETALTAVCAVSVFQSTE
jgi:hypothetical protein